MGDYCKFLGIIFYSARLDGRGEVRGLRTVHEAPSPPPSRPSDSERSPRPIVPGGGPQAIAVLEDFYKSTGGVPKEDWELAQVAAVCM